MTQAIKQVASWFKRILQAVLQHPNAFHAEGVIDNMRSQRVRTGYHRLFTIRWYETFGKDIQHHELPVSAYNEVARLVKGDGFDDGDKVSIIGKIKTHTGEIYVELIDIQLQSAEKV